MKQIRMAQPSDLAEFRALWDISFSDTQAFRNWFFAHRFVPGYSCCIEEDGRLVSAVQSVPCHIRVRGKILPAAVMVGACTHPDYKRRGYMKELYTFYMNEMAKLGVVLAAHTPAVLGTYFYVGHFPVSDTAFLEGEGIAVQESAACPVDMQEEVSALLACYQQSGARYSGILSRSFADMVLKMADYGADGGKALALWKEGQIAAYGVYYDTEEMVYAEEVMALTEADEQQVVNGLANLAQGKKVKIKLPPDTKAALPGASKTVLPRNVLGLCNVEALLSALSVDLAEAVEIKDDVVAQNDGVFLLSGKRSAQKPAVSLQQGRLLQFLMGYRSLEQLAQKGNATILDQEAAKRMDACLPVVPCHIVDEY